MLNQSEHTGVEEATVREYYRLVDADDVDGLLALFADDAVYCRPGHPTMQGRADLAEVLRRRAHHRPRPSHAGPGRDAQPADRGERLL